MNAAWLAHWRTSCFYFPARVASHRRRDNLDITKLKLTCGRLA
jgi:hypothetical protein